MLVKKKSDKKQWITDTRLTNPVIKTIRGKNLIYKYTVTIRFEITSAYRRYFMLLNATNAPA